MSFVILAKHLYLTSNVKVGAFYHFKLADCFVNLELLAAHLLSTFIIAINCFIKTDFIMFRCFFEDDHLPAPITGADYVSERASLLMKIDVFTFHGLIAPLLEQIISLVGARNYLKAAIVVKMVIHGTSFNFISTCIGAGYF
jgi:hypothetical protein